MFVISYHNKAYAVDFCPATRLGGTFFLRYWPRGTPDQSFIVA